MESPHVSKLVAKCTSRCWKRVSAKAEAFRWFVDDVTIKIDKIYFYLKSQLILIVDENLKSWKASMNILRFKTVFLSQSFVKI